MHVQCGYKEGGLRSTDTAAPCFPHTTRNSHPSIYCTGGLPRQTDTVASCYRAPPSPVQAVYLASEWWLSLWSRAPLSSQQELR